MLAPTEKLVALVVDDERLEVLGDDADRLCRSDRACRHRARSSCCGTRGRRRRRRCPRGWPSRSSRAAGSGRLTSSSSSTPSRAHDVGIAAVERPDTGAGRPRPGRSARPATPSQERRHRQALGLEPLGEPGRADPVDQLERTPFPVVAEPHRLIDRGDVVGDLGHQRGGVGERPRASRARRSAPAGSSAARTAARRPPPSRHRRVSSRGFGAARYSPVSRSIASLTRWPFVLGQAIEAALALAAGVAVGDQPRRSAANSRSTSWNGSSGWQRRPQARRDVRQQVDADQVERARRRRSWGCRAGGP